MMVSMLVAWWVAGGLSAIGALALVGARAIMASRKAALEDAEKKRESDASTIRELEEMLRSMTQNRRTGVLETTEYAQFDEIRQMLQRADDLPACGTYAIAVRLVLEERKKLSNLAKYALDALGSEFVGGGMIDVERRELMLAAVARDIRAELQRMGVAGANVEKGKARE